MDNLQFALRFNSALANVDDNNELLQNIAFGDCSQYQLAAIRALIDEYGASKFKDQLEQVAKKTTDILLQNELEKLLSPADRPIITLTDKELYFKRMWATKPNQCKQSLFDILSANINDNKDLIVNCLSKLLYDCYSKSQRAVLLDILPTIHNLVLDKNLPVRSEFITRLFGIRDYNFQQENVRQFTEHVANIIDNGITRDNIVDLSMVLFTAIDNAKDHIRLQIIDYLIGWVTAPPFAEYLTIRECYRYQLYTTDKILQTGDLRYQILLIDFLLQVSNNENLSTFIRGDALDVLLRNGVPAEYRQQLNDAQTALEQIAEYGERNLRLQRNEFGGDVFIMNQQFQPTIAGTTFASSQTVHATGINNGIKTAIECLLNDPEIVGNTIYKVVDDITETINEIGEQDYNNTTAEQRRTALLALQRFVTDPAVFTERKVNLSTILVLVWNRIVRSEFKDELCNRLIEELSEAFNMCASGHLTRILAVLEGFFPDITQFQDFDRQLADNIQARIYAIVRAANEDLQGDLLIAMADKFCPEYQIYVDHLAEHKDLVYEELFAEFVPDYLSEKTFDNVFGATWPNN